MTDTRDILRRGVGNFEPGADGYEQVIGRLERKRRNQRIVARTLAVAVMLIVSLAFLAAIRSDPPADDGPPPPGIVPSGKIAYSDLDPDSPNDVITVIEPDGSGRVQLTSGDVDSAYPVWSPDGSKIAFIRSGIAVFTMNADGSDQALVQGPINGSDSFLQPSWSPDGTQLLFFAGTSGCGKGDSTQLYVVNVDGSGLTRITRGCHEYFWPSWSPDGETIAVRSGPGGDLATMSPDGSNRTVLVPGRIDYPTWSPDGQIQFIQHQAGSGWDVFRINTDATGLTQLTYHNDLELFPVSSSDGTQIAYRSHAGIFTVSIGRNGSPARVTDVTWTEAPLSWQPTTSLSADSLPTNAAIVHGWPGARSNPAGRYSWDALRTSWMHNPNDDSVGVSITFSPFAKSYEGEPTPVTVAGYDGTYQEPPIGADGIRTELWIVDIEDASVTITIEAPPGTTEAELAEAHGVIGSIRSEPQDNAASFRLTFTLPDGWDSG